MASLLTIIVPAYNVEAYIGQCLQSLINQSLMNHKVVIVNDGSTDGTEEVCLEYKERYPDLITYIRQENQGLGEARNVGMRYVDTPYLSFLDSDDWLNSGYVETFARLVEEADEAPDLVFTLPWIYDEANHRITPWMDKPRYDQIFQMKGDRSRIETNARKTPELYALEMNACRKIYRTAFLQGQNFTFPKGLKWEDVPGHFQVVHEANTCIAMPEASFFYRINRGGAITAGSGVTRLDMIPIFRQLLEIQETYDFTGVERAYVIRLIVDFSKWSVGVTNLQYIGELLEGLHKIYQNLKETDLNYYLEQLSSDKAYESGFIACILGDDYLALSDYMTRDDVIRRYARWRNKKYNIVRGGIQCIQDHGLSYTILLALRKLRRRLQAYGERTGIRR